MLSKGSAWGGWILRAKSDDAEDLLLKLAGVFGTEVTTLPAAISYNCISEDIVHLVTIAHWILIPWRG